MGGNHPRRAAALLTRKRLGLLDKNYVSTHFGKNPPFITQPGEEQNEVSGAGALLRICEEIPFGPLE